MNQPEQSPQPNQASMDPAYLDVLDGLDIPDIACQIRRIEREADEEYAALPNQVEEEGLPTEPLDELAELFYLSDPKPAVFTGVAYEIKDNDDLDIDEPKLFVDAETTFEGTDYTEIDDAFRVMFYLKQTVTNQETQRKTSTRYAAFLESILRLEYIQEPLLVMLARHSDNARQLVTSKDFLRTRCNEQVGLLQSAAVACSSELHLYVDTDDVAVTCQSYVVRHDGRKGEIPKLTARAQPNVTVRGKLSGCMYLDVLNRGERPFRTVDDFAYGLVPYVVLRDNEARKTTYVAIDQVTAME